MDFELNPGEKVLLKKSANHFRGIEAAGGKLRVTNQRLYFSAHAVNLQREPLEIALDQVAELRRKNTYGLIPNGLVVATRNGEEHQFVPIWGRDKVIAAVTPYLDGGAAGAADSSPPEPRAEPEVAERTFCEKCGAKLRQGTVFCEKCGERV